MNNEMRRAREVAQDMTSIAEDERACMLHAIDTLIATLRAKMPSTDRLIRARQQFLDVLADAAADLASAELDENPEDYVDDDRKDEDDQWDYVCIE